MISFMVLAGPRSATTWMANLLNTDSTFCMHDPLLEFPRHVVDQIEIPDKRFGISCTSSLLWLDWVNAHKCPKVLLYRDPHEMNASLRALGLRELDPAHHTARMNAVKGARIYPHSAVFTWHIAEEIANFLDVPIDRWRFEELKKMNVQPQFSRVPLGKEAVQELVRRLGEELKG